MARWLSLACILLLALGCQQQNVEANPITDAGSAIKFAFTIYEGIEKIKKILAGPPTKDEQLSNAEIRMISKLQRISDDVDVFKKELFKKLSKDLQTKLGAKIEALLGDVHRIDQTYEKFLKYAKEYNEFENNTIKGFAETTTTDSWGQMSEAMIAVHKKFTYRDYTKDESILSVLADNTNMELMCVRNLSLYQIIIQLYETVIVSHMKGLTVKLFSYEQKALYEVTDRNYTKERKVELDTFVQKTEETFAEVKAALASVSRQLYKCDPENHNKGTTYSSLQEIFQKYVNFERDFFGDGSCSEDCGAYKVSSQTCNSPFCDAQERKCSGILRDCESINKNMTLCNAPANSDRRYEWLETESGTKYGHYQYCDQSRTQNLLKEKAPLLRFCEYCVCTCETKKKDVTRYISLKKAVADTYKNYVITGVRFKELNNVFYIDIQQAVLGPKGSLIGTTRWKNINEIKRERLVNEAYVVDWDHRTVHFDDIEPKVEEPNKNRVVVGLQFQQDGVGLHLTVRTMEFDYATGTLNPATAKWHDNMSPKISRTPVTLDKPDDPTLRKDHVENSKTGQYVQFQTTDMDKDFGQYTIPFIDIQDVTSIVPTPLAGAGIFHRGIKGSGGFLALKVIQYDFTKHL